MICGMQAHAWRQLATRVRHGNSFLWQCTAMEMRQHVKIFTRQDRTTTGSCVELSTVSPHRCTVLCGAHATVVHVRAVCTFCADWFLDNCDTRFDLQGLRKQFVFICLFFWLTHHKCWQHNPCSGLSTLEVRAWLLPTNTLQFLLLFFHLAFYTQHGSRIQFSFCLLSFFSVFCVSISHRGLHAETNSVLSKFVFNIINFVCAHTVCLV